ncbi:MAG: T9SS type A sorting domain-containing protein, partial [Muribaculaceae bacterium]|nr:T9SS type A sorting domain-containing protein [Muribaculaceae bacterium]
LHISELYNNKADEPLNNDTWESHRAPDDWENAMQKLRGNYASAILLIHPNREWKMILQKKLIDRLDLSEVGLYNFEDYGDFWISRLNNKYSYTYNEEDGQLTIITDSIEELKKSRLTYAIETDEKPVISVVVTDNDANEIYDAKIRKLSESRYLAIPDFGDSFDTAVDQINNDSADFSIIYDINGRRITSFISNANICESLPKGIYIVKTKTTTKKIII